MTVFGENLTHTDIHGVQDGVFGDICPLGIFVIILNVMRIPIEPGQMDGGDIVVHQEFDRHQSGVIRDGFLLVQQVTIANLVIDTIGGDV